MAQNDAGEKSEKPTPKKRKDERKEGRVLQSKEVVMAISLIGVYYAFKLLYPVSEKYLAVSMKNYLSLIGTQETLVTSDMSQIFVSSLITIGISAIPLLLISAAFGIIPVIAQTRLFISFKSIKPKFSNMNPLKGLKRMISLRGFIELIKAVVKIIIIGVMIYTELKDEIYNLPGMMDMTVSQAVYYTGSIIFGAVKSIAIASLFLALFDFLYQRWDFEKNMRMTKQEVKEEYKQTEGDPQVKGKIRQIQRQRAMNRMMQKVPEADVIIRNPTHFAVALKYNTKENNAPVVIAKGADFTALKIIEIAQKHDIVITENKPLARALYKTVDIGMEIPQDFYQAVADVLAFVYRVKKKEFKKNE